MSMTRNHQGKYKKGIIRVPLNDLKGLQELVARGVQQVLGVVINLHLSDKALLYLLYPTLHYSGKHLCKIKRSHQGEFHKRTHFSEHTVCF